MENNRDRILNEISIERDCHFELPGSEYDQLHTPNDWIAIVSQYLSRGAIRKHTKVDETYYRESLIKAAAVIVAAIEHLDTKI